MASRYSELEVEIKGGGGVTGQREETRSASGVGGITQGLAGGGSLRSRLKLAEGSVDADMGIQSENGLLRLLMRKIIDDGRGWRADNELFSV
jgi:hypothetical protein